MLSINLLRNTRFLNIVGSCRSAQHMSPDLIRNCDIFKHKGDNCSLFMCCPLQPVVFYKFCAMATSCGTRNADVSSSAQCAVVILEELKSFKNASGLSIETKALAFCALYRSFALAQKLEILAYLSSLSLTQYEVATKAAQSFVDAKEKNEAILIKAEERLRNSLFGDLAWILNSISRVEGGIKFLIELRQDVLHFLNDEAMASSNPGLRVLSTAIKDLLAPCFSSDILQLDRVTWSSPGEILQKISEYEAVHPIRSWADLKRRLGPYRRCFVLNHPSLPMQPVAILHVALTSQIASSIHQFVPRNSITSGDTSDSENTIGVNEDMAKIDTAIFYSISSTQKGLTGVDLGQCLIKRAVRRLQAELPNIHHFSTLSPIPGFRSWLLHQIREAERGQKDFLTKKEIEKLSALIGGSSKDIVTELKNLIATNSWTKESEMIEILESILMRLCAYYLFLEKRRNYALDSVANFHLRNGAVIWRLNWMADLSPRGLNNSCGMMVNYRYYLDMCEENSHRYVKDYHIEVSNQIKDLAREGLDMRKTSRL